MNLNELTILQALQGLKNGNFSSEELTKTCLNRIKKTDGKIKAFITVCTKSAIKQAKQADVLIKKDKNIFAEKPLLGIPFAIKDNFCAKGIKTTASSKVLENYAPEYNATVYEKLTSTGAILVGKTNMDAWAHGSSTETSDFFTTKNPWDLDYLPGGSSGGSTAAVIADQVIFAIGSETAGSIRQPASWCGVVGLKPSYGRVSRYGVIAMASSTDSPGPITKTVKDAGLILQILAGKDEMDATTSFESVPTYLSKNLNIRKLKIGVPKQYFLKEMDKGVKKSILDAINVFKQKGAIIKQINLLDPKYSVAVYTIIQRAEVSSNLGRYDGIRYGNNRHFFGQEAKRRIMLGTYALSAGYYDQYYAKAQKVRALMIKDFEKVFKKVDVLISPTCPTTALKVGASENQSMFGEIQDILVEASSLAGLPGLNICSGFSKSNLPIGMQIIGPQFSEDMLLKVGHFYQQITNWHKRKPKL
ncbi:MAG: Asp-tRNA(Asn)/Glu-tRNA(Gln) amidotransferase subunit GatA [Candidatus Pacebacteria bacterium]|nr:Asp-tRNA(Asn)/Glu-tRNA(Gln) amidotransferase subunit GatA [Candidatus Paceibacterota bacterium]